MSKIVASFTLRKKMLRVTIYFTIFLRIVNVVNFTLTNGGMYGCQFNIHWIYISLNLSNHLKENEENNLHAICNYNTNFRRSTGLFMSNTKRIRYKVLTISCNLIFYANTLEMENKPTRN